MVQTLVSWAAQKALSMALTSLSDPTVSGKIIDDLAGTAKSHLGAAAGPIVDELVTLLKASLVPKT